MKKHLLIAALTTIAASTTYAQSKFEGFYGQAGVGYFSGTPTLSNSSITSPAGVNFPQTSSIDSTSGFNGLISAGYTFSLNKQYTLGLGIDYQPFTGQSGNYSQTNANIVPNPMTGTYKVNSASSIYLAPGIALSPDKLLYAKVGYSMLQAKISPTGGSSGTTDYTGYLLGLGYKQIIKGGLYGFGEINYSSYGNQTTPSSGPWGGGGTYTSTSQSSINTFNTIVGVGYKF